MTIPQTQFPPWSAPEGYGNSWIGNRDHSITVLPGSVLGLGPNFDDGAAINAAFSRLPSVVTTGNQTGDPSARVGTVRLGPYPYNLRTGIVKPAMCNLIGHGPATVLTAAASGITCLYTHSTVKPGQQFGAPAIFTMGKISDLVIDGTLAGANAIGLDIGDGWGHTVRDVAIQNFTGTNALALYFVNRFFWGEKCNFEHMSFSNNTKAGTFDTIASPADVSNEYNIFDFNVIAQAGQDGFTLTNSIGGTGVNWGGCHWTIRGNMSSQSSLAIAESLALIRLLNGARLFQGTLRTKVEGNSGPGTPGGSNFPYFMLSDGTGNVKEVGGHIAHSIGNSNANSVLNGAEFTFGGKIAGDPDLAKMFSDGVSGTRTTQAAVPASGTPFPNFGPDFNVVIAAAAGGTTSVAVNNSGTVVVPASGVCSFYINAGGTLTLTYGVGNAPTWTWQTACQMSN